MGEQFPGVVFENTLNKQGVRWVASGNMYQILIGAHFPAQPSPHT